MPPRHSRGREVAFSCGRRRSTIGPSAWRVVLGTVDGFLLNLRGAFILELPGPRIIITVNLEIITAIGGLSSDGMDATSLDVGIIGILDLDFGAGQITLGVMIDLEDLLADLDPDSHSALLQLEPALRAGISGSAPSRRQRAPTFSGSCAAAAIS